MSRFPRAYCEVENCTLHAYTHYLQSDLSLCRWHSYLFEKAGQSNDEPICQRLLERLPSNKREAEESVRAL